MPEDNRKYTEPKRREAAGRLSRDEFTTENPRRSSDPRRTTPGGANHDQRRRPGKRRGWTTWVLAALSIAVVAVVGLLGFRSLNLDDATDPATDKVASAASDGGAAADEGAAAGEGAAAETASSGESSTGEGDDVEPSPDSTAGAPSVPYIEAVLVENEFVLSGVVPNPEVAAGLVEAGQLTYSPYFRSELQVDEDLEPVDWLITSPQLLTVLPTLSDATMVISDGEIRVTSGRSAEAEFVERLEGTLAAVSGLPVTVENVEITNLREPLYSVAASGGTVTLSGTIPSEQVRESLYGGAVRFYEDANVVDEMVVDDGVYGTLIMYKGELLFNILRVFADYRLDLNGTGYTGFLSGGFNFETDSAAISDEYAEFLDFGIGSLLRNPTVRFAVVGHTDSQGPDQYNLELSQRRADAVRNYYIDAGLDPSRIVAVGRGESEPSAPNDTEDGRRQNRRIDFIANPGDEILQQDTDGG